MSADHCPSRHSAQLAGLLDAVRAFIRDYVIVTGAQADTLTLWVAHTHVLDAFETTPFLALTSPTKRCGKSRTLDVLELFVARPWRVITPSEAVLYRKIKAVAPTLLLDETDAIFNAKNGDTEPLRALLNAGNRRGTSVPRCVGPQQELVDFPTYCPKVLAGIGKLPDTITDRAVVVRLTRKRKDEQALRFRHREALERAEPVHTALASWAIDAVDDLAALRPDMPRELNDRAKEAWEPLVAIADLAGADWPARVRAAAATMSAPDVRDEETLGIMLLRDIAGVFRDPRTDKLFSRDLVARLNELDESPWGDLRGKSLDERGLARRLRAFGIRSKTLRIEDDERAKGYSLDDLADVLSRYVDDFERDTVTSERSSQNQPNPDHAREGGSTTRKHAFANGCHGVTPNTAGEPWPAGVPRLGKDGFAAFLLGRFEAGHLTRREVAERVRLHEVARAANADIRFGHDQSAEDENIPFP